jgi:fido (protein-threonine AMPylation protein)
MYDKIKILDLISQKQVKQFELESLLYGSIEVREKDNKKYIYIHAREDGLQVTKYVGEYTEVLYNLISNNNIKAKELKKEIRNIEKELKRLDYTDEELTLKVSNNIDFAKRKLANTIYNQAILEGVVTTLSDTENIIEGGIINNMSPIDVLKVINLKHAWEFILNKNVILSKTDYNTLCMINRLVLEGFYYTAGMLRTVPVDIGGTSWKPDIPIEEDIKNDIDKIVNSSKSSIDIAIDLLLYVVRSQMFIDGNKRTSVIFANHYLISKGKGLIVIPIDKINRYKELLIEYYETNTKNKISKFIKDECYFMI